MTPVRSQPAANPAALAVLTLALLAGLLGSLVAACAPDSATSTSTGVPPTRPASLPRLAGEFRPGTSPADGPHLQLRVASMTPRVVTATGPATLTLTGELVNTGNQVVRDIEIRAQRGDRLRSEGDVRTALSGNAANDVITPAFAALTNELAPGARIPVRFSVPLRGSTSDSLALQHTGVYELLINVNGSPSGGAQARMAGVRMLLPVLGLPPAPGRPPTPASRAKTSPPAPVTVLYPLAGQPRRLPTGPGEPVLLGDDQLATSLSAGGRLDGLLSALETAARAGSPVRDALCLAVDPDLLRTVSDMSGGYRVVGPNGQQTEGRGATAAGQWLDRLRSVAAGRCVIALPFADADLVALSRAGLSDLNRYATVSGAQVAAQILHTPVRAATTWPAEGLLDDRSLSDYVHAGGKQVVLSADAVALNSRSSLGPTGGPVRLSTASAQAMGVLADPLVSQAALGERGPSALGGGLGPGSDSGLSTLLSGTEVSPADTGTTLSAQDAIGAIAFRALSESGTSTVSGATVAPLLIAPPHRWNVTRDDAGELLGAVSALISAGRLTPATLPDDATSPAAPDGTVQPDAPGGGLVYPVRAGAREVPASVTDELRLDRDAANDLRAAAEAEPGAGFTPAQVFDPVTEGLLRAASAVWRGNPRLSDQATTVITERVALLRSLVRVVEPPSPYSLGDREAPLPITLANGLPVAMRVRVMLSDTPGLRTAAIPEQRIPPLGRLQLRVNAQLTRSGQFTVEARLTTLRGSPLGAPSRLLLRSTAYGTITLWLTGTAGLLLVILAVRRIARRLRGATNQQAEAGRARPAGQSSPREPVEVPVAQVAGSRAPPSPVPTKTGTQPRRMPRSARRGAEVAAHTRRFGSTEPARNSTDRLGQPTTRPRTPPSGDPAAPSGQPSAPKAPLAPPVAPGGRTPPASAPPAPVRASADVPRFASNRAIPPTPTNPGERGYRTPPSGQPIPPVGQPIPPANRATAPTRRVNPATQPNGRVNPATAPNRQVTPPPNLPPNPPPTPPPPMPPSSMGFPPPSTGDERTPRTRTGPAPTSPTTWSEPPTPPSRIQDVPARDPRTPAG